MSKGSEGSFRSSKHLERKARWERKWTEVVSQPDCEPGRHLCEHSCLRVGRKGLGPRVTTENIGQGHVLRDNGLATVFCM